VKLFIGLPTYGGQRFNTMALLSVVKKNKFFTEVHAMEVDGSLLAASFNRCLIQAMRMRDQKEADFFLLMHADIVPVENTLWLDHLMEARQFARLQYKDNEPYKAQVLSVVSPIKDLRGVTSTGYEGESIWAPKRFTMKQILEGPETFTRDDLLINTGMLLIDLRNNDWIEKVRFTISDAIITDSTGLRMPGVQPEDWQFSRDVRSFGVKLWATRKVKIVHRGLFNYPNFAVWGKDEDPGDEH
jgi:hypothetical protein